VKLEVNNACDLSCPMCYTKKGDDLLPMADITRLLDDIGDVGTRLEILGGEPLLRGDLAEIIRYAKERAGIPEVVLYTNGRYADREHSQELREAGLPPSTRPTSIGSRRSMRSSRRASGRTPCSTSTSRNGGTTR